MIRTLSRTVLAISLCWALQSCGGDNGDDTTEGLPTLSAGTPTVSALDSSTGESVTPVVVDFVTATLSYR